MLNDFYLCTIGFVYFLFIFLLIMYILLGSFDMQILLRNQIENKENIFNINIFIAVNMHLFSLNMHFPY